MRMARRFSNLFLLAFLGWFYIFATKVKSDQQPERFESEISEPVKMQGELEEKRRLLEQLNQEEGRIFADILELEDRLDLSERLIRRLISKQRSIQMELLAKRTNLRSIDSALCFYRENYENRLRKIYKHGRARLHTTTLVISPPSDLANKYELSKRILREDHECLSTAEAVRTDLVEKRADLNRLEPELSSLRRNEDDKRGFHFKELVRKERLLGKIKSEKRMYSQAIKELEDALRSYRYSDEFKDKFDRDESDSLKSKNRFAAQKGRLPWPIKGKLFSTYGVQVDRFFHTTIQNPGIEITAEDDSEVVAVSDGEVIHSSRLRGYVHVLLIGHGEEYYTLYARLSKILVSPGDKVRRLQKIGLVEQNGFSNVPCLHFEIRKGKESLDPMEWLR